LNAVLAETATLLRSFPQQGSPKPQETGTKMQEFVPKLIAVQGKVASIKGRLEELGKKYNIDVSKVIPANRKVSSARIPASQPAVTTPK